MKSKLRLIVLGSLLALSFTSCAGNLPSGALEENSAFSLLANEGDTASAHKGHHGKKGKHHGSMMFMFMTRDLGLTADQQASLKALMQKGSEDHAAVKTQFKDFKAKVQTAFLSDTFNASALQTEWEGIKKPDANSSQLKMAEKLKAAWTILTPEQQAKIEKRLADMETRMAEHAGAKAGDANGHQDKMLAHMADKLNLTAAQQSTLKTRWEDKSADRQSRHGLMKGVKQAVLDQLKAGASVTEIAQSMAPLTDAMEGKSNGYLNRLAELHDVLTAEQRQLLVSSMEDHKGHGRGGRHKR